MARESELQGRRGLTKQLKVSWASLISKTDHRSLTIIYLKFEFDYILLMVMYKKHGQVKGTNFESNTCQTLV